MKGIAGRGSKHNLRTSGAWLLPEYITEFVGDEDRLAVLREAQRSWPFGEIPGVLRESHYLVAK